MARYRGRHAATGQGSTAGRHRISGGTRLRRGLGGTAVAAVVMAALTASQAPGVGLGGPQRDDGNGRTDAVEDRTPGDGSYHTELPPLESPNPPGDEAPGGGTESGIPASLLAAYKKAAASLSSSSPGCGLRWELLAAIGKVESGHARGGAVDKDGTTRQPILGPVLNGQGFASIKDTDGGEWDGDSTYDRAVGPMQFIPSTWSRWGADGNGDGRKDPNNIHDAALAAGQYLCAGGRDLAVKADLDRAVLSYNNSAEYLRTVLAWFEYYRKGTHEVPDGEGVLPTSPGAGGAGDSSGGTASPGRGHGSGDGGSGGSHKPGKPGKPDKPGSEKPDKPGGPEKPGDGNGGDDGNDGDNGDDGGSPSPGPTAPAALEAVSPGSFTAVAGEDFTERPRVRAEDAQGKGVEDVEITFEVTGRTGASFDKGAKKFAVRTDAKGLATAPVLHAGAEPGDFVLRATVQGGKLKPVEFRASVTAPQPDGLARTGEAALEGAAGEDIAAPVEVRATHKGEPVPGAVVKAAMADQGKGPYFTDEDGKPLRTLQLTADDKGVLKLPPIHAGDEAGTWTLILRTGSAELKLELTVKG